jgi:hypothetical protein
MFFQAQSQWLHVYFFKKCTFFQGQNLGSVASLGMSSTSRAFHKKLAAVRVIRQSIIPRDMPWSDQFQTTQAPVAAAPGK